MPTSGDTPYARQVELGGRVALLGAPLKHVTLVHHAEAVAQVPGKRRVSYGMPVIVGGERRWRTFSGIDTSEGALPYERVLDGEEDYVEHIARSALAAGAGRSGPVGEGTAHLFDARALAEQALAEHAVGWIERNFASGTSAGVSKCGFHCRLGSRYRPGPFVKTLGVYTPLTTTRPRSPMLDHENPLSPQNAFPVSNKG